MARIFCDSGASPAAQRAALEAAVNEHSRLIGECKRGLGVDRHLLAMRQTGAASCLRVASASALYVPFLCALDLPLHHMSFRGSG
jgi:hypothetical protein